MIGSDRDPLVSVITATYNSRRTLQYALKSIQAQSFQDFEVLVVGDACTDDSEKVVRRLRDGRFLWVNLDTNHGSQAVPNNEGIRRARGKYIAFLGHDDLWFPWHLKDLLAHARKHDADMVHSICPVIGPAGVYDILAEPQEKTDYDWHFVPPSCWVVTREILDRLGPWPDPSTLDRGVDHEVLRRLHRASARISCCQDVTILKFPSADWGIYSSQNDFPQPLYWRRMEKDPNLLSRSILLNFASTYSRSLRTRNVTPNPSFQIMWESVRTATLVVMKYLLGLYGREKEPLRSLFVRRMQRSRRYRRAIRGL